MTTTSSSAGSIVVGVDGSEDSHRAVVWAADQAALENRPLTLLHAADPYTAFGVYAGGGYPMIETDEMHEGLETAAQGLLAEAALQAELVHPGLHVASLHARSDPRQALLAEAERAALVVVGSRGRGHAASLLLGSVSATVAAGSVGPVVVVRPPASDAKIARVLVGVRFAVGSAPVVEYAFAQASLRSLPLTVAHCYFDTESANYPPQQASAARRDLDSLREQLAQSVAGLSEKYPDVEVELNLTTGAFRDVLADAASVYDLVVIGRRSGSRFDRVVGTWSTMSIVEHASGAVAVVPEARS